MSAALCLCALGFFLLVLLPIFIPCFRLVCYRGRCIGLSHYLSLSLYLIMSAVSQFFELLICMPGLAACATRAAWACVDVYVCVHAADGILATNVTRNAYEQASQPPNTMNEKNKTRAFEK